MIDGLNYTSAEIAKIVGGRLEGESAYIDSLSIDSREENMQGACFFAIKGKNFNGASFASEAEKKGARLMVAQEKINACVPVIYVDDTRKALGRLAKQRKGKTKVVGVTGSVGKTTVKDMIISVLSQKYVTVGTPKNNNNEIGVSLTLLSLKSEDFCVLEMGMRGRGQIDWLSEISVPDTAVITNAGSAHIGLLGSEENIFLAKTEILNHTQRYAVLPMDERFAKLDVKDLTKVLVGYDCDAFPTGIIHTKNGIRFNLGNIKNIEMSTVYDHNANNSAFAYAVGRIYGLKDEEIKSGIIKFCPEKGRGNVLEIGGLTVIDDTYNASFEGVKASLLSLVKFCKANEKMPSLILGDMLEQGAYALENHTKIGQLCRELGVEKLFVYGEASRWYLDGYGGGEKIDGFDDIVPIITKKLDKNYVLLVKASRALNFDKIIERMKNENGKQ